MTVLWVVGCWVALDVPLALLVGRFLAVCARGEEQ